MQRLALAFTLACLSLQACTQAAPPPPPAAPAAPVAKKPPPEPPHHKVPQMLVDQAPRPWVMGVALPFGPTVGVRDAAKAEKYFTKAIGGPVETRLYDYDSLAQAVIDGKVDFAFMPPLAYVKATQKTKVTLLRQAMHNGSLLYRSVLFVRGDSPIKSMDDFKGHSVAWVDGGSTSGRLVPLAWLDSRHINPAEYFTSQVSFPDHGKVCEAVRDGRADIGASFANNKGEAQPIVDGCVPSLGAKASDLRILYMSANIPNDVMVSRGDNPALADALGDELDHLGATEDGREVLSSGFQADGFYPVEDSTFDPIRTLFSTMVEPVDAGAKK